PPFNGLAPLDALRAGEPRWLEDFPQDSKRYLLIGEPPERWRSRAWLPVPGEEGADACVGVLRSGEQPFSPSDRAHLLEVARLCAGPLRTFTAAAQGTGAASADPVGSLFEDPKSTRLNSSHVKISYAVFCLKTNKMMRPHAR